MEKAKPSLQRYSFEGKYGCQGNQLAREQHLGRDERRMDFNGDRLGGAASLSLEEKQ
jgi:hypothetical protein